MGKSERSIRNERAPKVILEVTEELVRDSKLRDSSHCMIAQAVKAARPDASRVAVDLQTIRFSDPSKHRRYTYLTPRIAQVALVNFDQGIAPEPFTVRLKQGQVTLSGSRQVRADNPVSEKQRLQRIEASKRSVALRKGHLSSAKDSGSVPEKIGGRTPPSTPFSRRRAFGLRALSM